VDALIDERGFTYELDLAPGEQWKVLFVVTPYAEQPRLQVLSRQAQGTFDEVAQAKAKELQRWLRATPILEAAPSLLRTYQASLADMAALRLQADLTELGTVPAAGLPWFMTLFGRDSLITSFQALPYLPELAATTLRVLAERQARTRDDFHEQEPGKILHEQRFGEMTANGETPHDPYFGSADATPLFLILLSEYYQWTKDAALVCELEVQARAALDWIRDSGDIDGDGYVEYQQRNLVSGLQNQCWKDSWDSIQFADGGLARGPIAVCEIQGYVYDALTRCAHLARMFWEDPLLADDLELRARTLRANFHRDFWLSERGHYALALDGDKRAVDALASNIGHLLWSGILDQEFADYTAQSLLEGDLFSGWGVRTLASSSRGYNPLGYHTGTVWPHENSLIAAGLARYGHNEAAERLAAAVLAAAPYFEFRLPEVFAGFAQTMTQVPVAFPTASRPQAWSAGAPLHLLTTLLSLRPHYKQAQVQCGHGLGEIVLASR